MDSDFSKDYKRRKSQKQESRKKGKQQLNYEYSKYIKGN